MSMNTQNILNIAHRLIASNSGEDPNQNNKNGFRCLICNLVFLTFQALIMHVESHLSLEDPAIRVLYSPNQVNSRREVIPNPLHPNFSRLMVMQETNVFVNNRVFQPPLEQPMVMQEPQFSVNNRLFHAQPEQPRMIPPSRATYVTQGGAAASRSLQGSPYSMLPASSDVIEVAQLLLDTIHEREMEVSPIDGTKPYINLLDKPINGENFNQDIINAEALDLALRL
ncbi:hypothetical protein LR48_Vigan02g172100 [Vigna angularis]|uniref:C2H2-type domain-containing protein n=2 Tax=Phaseolus angularis TaxID=3914 RepID=A0A0L9TYI9_PHAAN|nr:uncharacterized protein HKW66_Vig0232740 [Vigna angularis]KOM35571.1 hypothetical protein LR48_Vigan02g172100 [Vigna angularis]BAT94790.1 hypothetical protein VIGAN_08142600 [Vigna angularis var. angularis]